MLRLRQPRSVNLLPNGTKMRALIPPEAEAANILIRGVNWLGDAVMTTPALQRLRERYPQSKITLVTPDKLKDLWQHHPAVDEVLPFAPKESVIRVASRIRGWKFLKTAAEFEKGRLQGEHRNLNEAIGRAMLFYSLIGDFRALPFQMAVVFPNSPRSALETWLARIPRRVGYARPWRSWMLTDRIPDREGVVKMRKRSAREIRQLASSDNSSSKGSLASPSASAHHIFQYLHLVGALGANPEPLAPRLEIPPTEEHAIRESLLRETCERWSGLPSDDIRFLAINPSAAYGPAKRWPADRFAEVVRAVCERAPNVVWVTIGGPDDVAICEEVIGLAKNRVLNRAGKSTLREMMSILKVSEALLTNDSGPMHVAAALGTPVIVPFGSTSVALTGPGLPGDSRHQLLSANASCSPCFLRECPIDFRCMTGISTETVLAPVLKILGKQF